MVVRCLFVEKICLYYFRILLKSSFLIIILEVVFRLGISLLLYFLMLVRIIYYVGVIFKSIKNMKKLIFRTKRSMVIFLLLLSPVLAIAQVVTGKVVLFDDKEALPGVNVLEKVRRMVRSLILMEIILFI